MIRVVPPAPLKQHGTEGMPQRPQPTQAPVPTGPRKLAELPKDFQPGQNPIRIEDLTRSLQTEKIRSDAAGTTPPTAEDEEEERKGAALKPRQHRPYKSVAGTSLESRVVELTKKIGVTESKMQGLRDKLKQHTDELALRETQGAAPASEVA